MEPIDLDGNKVDLHAYSQGAYDAYSATFIQTIKNHGITDSQMGEWMMFSEANLPEWSSTDPGYFVANVNRLGHQFKAAFPGMELTIMLDTMSYDSGDVNYEHGQSKSLAPYVSGINHGILDSFGLQGFPWAPPANVNDEPNYDAAAFMNHSRATEAAGILGVKNIWFNTGTFTTMYAGQPGKTVNASVQQRQQILNSILGQVKATQSAGYNVAVNVFAENKANFGEAIDWSYWHDGQQATSPFTGIFKDFIVQLKGSGADFWLFDTFH